VKVALLVSKSGTFTHQKSHFQTAIKALLEQKNIIFADKNEDKGKRKLI